MSDDLIGQTDCLVCVGRGRICTGISFPPGSTYQVKAEYEPCPECQPGPHGFFARRTAQILQDLCNRRMAHE